MKAISNQIIEAMPIKLLNEFRRKAFCLMLDTIEGVEVRYGTLNNQEISFLKTLQSIEDHQERFNCMCEAFGKIMFMHKILDDQSKFEAFTSNRSQSNEFNPFSD
jgi:hypothetical protein